MLKWAKNWLINRMINQLRTISSTKTKIYNKQLKTQKLMRVRAITSIKLKISKWKLHSNKVKKKCKRKNRKVMSPTMSSIPLKMKLSRIRLLYWIKLLISWPRKKINNWMNWHLTPILNKIMQRQTVKVQQKEFTTHQLKTSVWVEYQVHLILYRKQGWMKSKRPEFHHK